MTKPSKKMKFETEMLAVLHGTAQDLVDAGVVPKEKMKIFDEMCLTPPKKMKPKEIRALRLREDVSQSTFARYLRVTPGLVSQWERGKKKPSGPSSTLLALVELEGLGLLARI